MGVCQLRKAATDEVLGRRTVSNDVCVYLMCYTSSALPDSLLTKCLDRPQQHPVLILVDELDSTRFKSTQRQHAPRAARSSPLDQTTIYCNATSFPHHHLPLCPYPRISGVSATERTYHGKGRTPCVRPTHHSSPHPSSGGCACSPVSLQKAVTARQGCAVPSRRSTARWCLSCNSTWQWKACLRPAAKPTSIACASSFGTRQPRLVSVSCGSLPIDAPHEASDAFRPARLSFCSTALWWLRRRDAACASLYRACGRSIADCAR
ncbi:hypothetical protein BJ546DRAFT_585290 [Cryomyces antarcticus]